MKSPKKSTWKKWLNYDKEGNNRAGFELDKQHNLVSRASLEFIPVKRILADLRAENEGDGAQDIYSILIDEFIEWVDGGGKLYRTRRKHLRMELPILA